MERPRPSRHTTILIGIGLVLIGLLGGILMMLLVVDARERYTPVPQVVERVELGRPQPLRTAPASDTAAPVLDLRTLNQLFREVAGEVTPSVVYIQVETSSSRDVPRDWFHNFEGDADRLLREMPRESVGSGVIISQQGYIVTNNHVVDRASTILVTLADKRQFEAKVVGIDTSTDLAVIKIENGGEALPVIALGDSDELEVGEWVLAIGNPFRLTSTVTAGIISALGRQVNIIDDPLRIEDFIQTDAAINPGNSGGALVNLRGELVGISTAIATESGSYEGYGFAVPVNLVERVVRDLISFGEVHRGYLGVSIQSIDAATASELGLSAIGGVYLNEVRHGGAAHLAGLQQGDVVLSIDGHHVDAPNELQSFLARRRPGDRIDLEVWRAGKRQKMNVQLLGRDDPAYQGWFSELEAAPETELYPEVEPQTPPGDVFELGQWGIGLRELTSREQDGFDLEQGVYVAFVEKGTVADAAGLPRDVVLQHIGTTPVASLEEAIHQLELAAETEDVVLLRVKRRTGTAAFYELEVPVE